MAETTKIAWCLNSDGTPGATFNPWIGCTRVSAGCANCYAEVLGTNRLGVEWGKGKPRHRTASATWKLPRRWNRKAAKLGIRIRVFCASLADVFDPEVPAEWRAELWQLIRETPNLDWIIVTKRPENIRAMLPDAWGGGWPNVWLVVTVEDQEAADRRIPILLSIPAKVRGLSLEPLLGPVNLTDIVDGREVIKPLAGLTWYPTPASFAHKGVTARRSAKINWVIVGGESGPWRKVRSCDISWISDLVYDCARANVAMFVKQLGSNPSWSGDEYPTSDPVGASPEEWPPYLRVQQMPGVSHG